MGDGPYTVVCKISYITCTLLIQGLNRTNDSFHFKTISLRALFRVLMLNLLALCLPSLFSWCGYMLPLFASPVFSIVYCQVYYLLFFSTISACRQFVLYYNLYERPFHSLENQNALCWQVKQPSVTINTSSNCLISSRIFFYIQLKNDENISLSICDTHFARKWNLIIVCILLLSLICKTFSW